MTVEADIFDAIKSTVAGRAYADIAKPGVGRPYAVYQQVGGVSVTYLERALASKKNGRFQVAVWATTRMEAAAIGLAIESALVEATTMQATPIGAAHADYDEDTELYGSRQDFSIWSDR